MQYKIYVINQLKEIEVFDMHDRILYTNYAIIDSPIGFNLNIKKLSNTMIISESIFEISAYRRLLNHTRVLKRYMKKLQGFKRLDKPYKVNSDKVYRDIESIL